MATIIVEFYRYSDNGEYPTKVVLDTHTTDHYEAYRIAIANGHDPRKLIRYTFKPL